MKYPIGIQDFRKLREGGYVYVDKTEHIHRIITGSSAFFLSRPRRFGKSLLLSTMNELYSGSKELFQGLWIDEHWDFEAERRPVIWIQFAGLAYKKRGLGEVLSEHLDHLATGLAVQLDPGTPQDKFRQLIREAGKAQKVVVLIDEYDKPIIDFLDDTAQAGANRDELKSFYSVLKDSDPHLEMVFITGVSAFSKVSIFSDLNHLENLTLSNGAATLAGITQGELEHYFSERLADFDGTEVRRWYNGYRWRGEETLYNPFSILNFLKDGEYNNYWFATGTPTFLMKLLKERERYQLPDLRTTVDYLLSFDHERLDPISILFQTGYLTIREYVREDRLYTLDFPNLEVRYSFDKLLLEEYLGRPEAGTGILVVDLRNALQRNDIETLVRLLNSSLAGIPYQLWQGQAEHFYHAVVHLTFRLIGTYIRSEVNSAHGRCDAIVETEHYIYAFEFKRDRSAAAAIEQIARKGYLLPYADSPKQRLAVGINFSTAQRQIDDWKVVEH